MAPKGRDLDLHRLQRSHEYPNSSSDSPQIEAETIKIEPSLSSFSTTTSSSSSSSSYTPNTTICNPNSGDGGGAAAGEGAGDYTTVKEGEAEILMDYTNSVFYNKAQVNNRDLSIAVLRTFISRRSEEHATMLSKKTHSGSKDLKAPRVLEALGASGLRALRYAREVDGIGEVVALDNDKVAVDACKKNIKLNGSQVSSKVAIHEADARVYMLTHPKEFDAVDLDPYGSPVAFLDSVVQILADGGLLMCTATDMAVLSGGNEGVCFSKYGSYPLKGKYCHEMALRILLACLESHANRHKRYIVPILSVQMDFYIRVFVRIFTFVSVLPVQRNAPHLNCRMCINVLVVIHFICKALEELFLRTTV